ncbi:hypothetical protein OKW76_00495 [Sphingomonas sp. S1-29]|uniref:hypothetical protein n=1 Tax=Sphingomonas sp. S1-29 TaxID=2991074 RepID=UPI00223FC30D|nr:hypothetical protein [Sphingomonas sp. S1-29]UZK69604.1 hypothetical protein OKW76_00495 [Sphingomonas sp. S1-29]
MNFFDRMGANRGFNFNTTPYANAPVEPYAYGRETLGGLAQPEQLGRPATQPEAEPNPFGLSPEEVAQIDNDPAFQAAPMQAPMEAPMQAPAQNFAAEMPMQDAPQQQGIVAGDMPPIGGVRGSGDGTMKALSSDQVRRASEVQDALGRMIRDGVPDAEIRAYIEQNGIGLTGLDEALAYRRSNPNAQIPVYAELTGEKIPEAAPPPEIGAWDAGAVGAKDGFSFGFSDEMGAAGDAIKYAVGVGPEMGGPANSFSDAYTQSREARRAEIRSAQYHQPGAFLAGQLGGGLITAPVTGLAGAGLRGSRIAAGLRGGAVSGGLYGVGTAEGDLRDHGEGALIGGTFGALTGGLVGGVGAGIERSFRSDRAGRVVDAARRVNESLQTQIAPSLAHLGRAGNGAGESLRGRLALGVRATPLGLPLDRTLTKFGDDIETGVERLAQRTGALSEDMAYTGARQLEARPGTIAGYRDVSRKISNGMYAQADSLGGGTMVAPTRTVAALDDTITRLSRTAGTQESRTTLQALRDELASQQWTVQGLRDLRTAYGRRLNSTDGVTRLDSSAMWSQLSRDITDGLQQAGKADAARAYRQADRYYARRTETNRIVDRIIGGSRGAPFNSAEVVARNLEQMGRIGSDDLQKVLRQLPRQEAEDVRGNLIRQLGMANPSKQGDVPTFSIQSFGTSWAKMTPRAKSALFDQQTVRDLDDLATLATASKSIPGNSSNSFTGAAGAAWSAQALGAGYAGYQLATGDGGLNGYGVAGALGVFGTGLLLGNRGIVRGLVNWGRTGKTAPLERTINTLLQRTRDNPAWQQELTTVRDAIVGHNGDPRVIVQPPQSNAPATDGEAVPQGGSIFDDDDLTVDPAAPNPFGGVAPDPVEEVAPMGPDYAGATAQQMVDEGLGEQPLY